MKKLTSVLLAVIIAFSCLAVIAFAADEEAGFSDVFAVNVAPESSAKLEITSLSGSNYVRKGESFSFTAKAIGDYVFDQTTVLKVANTHYAADLVLNGTREYGYILEPDANGVYTVENVQEELYIYACNLETSTFAGLKDFLLGMFNFFLDMMKWFFGV